jgi:hypothetical protein
MIEVLNLLFVFYILYRSRVPSCPVCGWKRFGGIDMRYWIPTSFLFTILFTLSKKFCCYLYLLQIVIPDYVIWDFYWLIEIHDYSSVLVSILHEFLYQFLNTYSTAIFKYPDPWYFLSINYVYFFFSRVQDSFFARINYVYFDYMLVSKLFMKLHDLCFLNIDCNDGYFYGAKYIRNTIFLSRVNLTMFL